MREWKLWDWIGYGTLGFAAFFIALEEGIKKLYPTDFLSSFNMAFLPFGLFCIGTLVLFCRAMGWIGDRTNKSNSNFSKWPDPYTPIVIAEKNFHNEKVLLDGHNYLKCKFENCTYIYNGTTTIQLNHCGFSGSIIFSSDNPSVTGTLMLMYAFGLLPEDMRLLGLGPTNVIEKVKHSVN